MCLSIYLPTQSPCHLVFLFCPLNYPSTHIAMYPIHTSMHTPIHPIHPSIHPFHLSIHPSIPSVHPSICPVHPSVCPSAPIYLSTFVFIHASIHPPSIHPPSIFAHCLQVLSLRLICHSDCRLLDPMTSKLTHLHLHACYTVSLSLRPPHISHPQGTLCHHPTTLTNHLPSSRYDRN